MGTGQKAKSVEWVIAKDHNKENELSKQTYVDAKMAGLSISTLLCKMPAG